MYAGSAAGLDPNPVVLAAPPDAYGFGLSMGSAGDVDADGYDDVVIGGHEGTFVHHGSADGLRAPTMIPLPENAYYRAHPTGVGDVNGDGYDDVVIGAPHWSAADGPREGRVYVYLGSPDGLRRPGWHADPVDTRGRFGSHVAPAGDVDGDGYDDVVVGMGHPGEGI